MPRKKPIRVRVIRRKGRPYLILKWHDRAGRAHEETTDATREREAWRAAARKEADLAEAEAVGAVPWEIVCQRYRAEVLAQQSRKSAASWSTAINQLEAIERPDQLGQVDAGLVSTWTSGLFGRGLGLASINSYLRELRRVVRWAAEIWPEFTPPRIRFARVNKHDAMRGRPVTSEEVDRMIAAAAGVVGAKYAPGWCLLLRGLWLSGLRLGEALELDWSREDRIHVWGIDAERPFLRILAASEKGRRDRLLPMIPEFAELLWSIPPGRRRGPVFRPSTRRGRARNLEYVSAVISRIGQAAGVIVATSRDRSTGAERIKWASAQDLRRGFGFRLAPLLHPLQLKELMRHESLETTLAYYVGVNAQRTARDVWVALSADPARPEAPVRAWEFGLSPRED